MENFKNLTEQEKIDLSFSLLDKLKALEETIKMGELANIDVSKFKTEFLDIESKLNWIKQNHRDILLLCKIQTMSIIKSQISNFTEQYRDLKIDLITNKNGR